MEGLAMTRYKVLDVPIEKNGVREIRVGGALVRGALGPADFPARIRVTFGTGSPMPVAIDFLYALAGDEAAVEHRSDGGVLYVGKDSGRVLRMTTTVDMPENAKGGRFELHVEDEVEPILRELKESAQQGKLFTHRPPARQLAHYSMMSDLLPWIDAQVAELQS
jgi:hypothetical protein